jgi:hypothetical protein
MRLFHFILPFFFLALGVGILCGWIFAGLPKGTGMREMLGLVTILFGVYRGALLIFAPPAPRRPYGGFREKFLGRKIENAGKNHESDQP